METMNELFVIFEAVNEIVSSNKIEFIVEPDTSELILTYNLYELILPELILNDNNEFKVANGHVNANFSEGKKVSLIL
jgi:hypothetical protein